MLEKVITKKALSDYAEIFKYISDDNPYFASKVLSSIDETVKLIQEFPYIGKQFNKKYRIIIEPQYKYKLVYKITGNILYIMGIFKYKNNWK